MVEDHELRDDAAGWLLSERADGLWEVQAIAGGPLSGDFAAYAAARAGTGDEARRAVALHGTRTPDSRFATRGRELARDLARHRRAIDGDEVGNGSRAPDGDDWNELDALARDLAGLLHGVVGAGAGTTTADRRRGFLAAAAFCAEDGPGEAGRAAWPFGAGVEVGALRRLLWVLLEGAPDAEAGVAPADVLTLVALLAPHLPAEEAARMRAAAVAARREVA